MSTSPSSPQDFARLLQDRLIEAGESRPLEFRSDLFGFVPRGAGIDRLFPLDNYFRHYLSAAGEKDRQQVLRQFVRDWQAHWKSLAYLPPTQDGSAAAIPALPAMARPGHMPARRQTVSGGRVVLVVLGLLGLLIGMMCIAPCILGAIVQHGAKRQLRNLPGRAWNFQQPPGSEVTEMLGGRGGGPRFFADPAEGPVVGLAYSHDQWGGETTLGSLQPLYRAGDQPEHDFRRAVISEWARPGYALGGLRVDANDYVNAVKAKWVKLDGDKLDWSDTYESEWLGDSTGRPTRELGGEGQQVIGLAVKQGLVVDSVGLILKRQVGPPR